MHDVISLDILEKENGDYQCLRRALINVWQLRWKTVRAFLLLLLFYVNRLRKNLIIKFNFVWHFFLFVPFDLLLIIHRRTSPIDQQCIRVMHISSCSISKYHYSVHDIQCDSYVNNVSERFSMLPLSLSSKGWSLDNRRKRMQWKRGRERNKDETTFGVETVSERERESVGDTSEWWLRINTDTFK